MTVRKRTLPTVSRLRSLLSYDEKTGKLLWIVDRGGCKSIKAGDVAGTVRADGYIVISIDGSPCLGHRVAWAIKTGSWSEKIIDHKDCDPGNNAWTNLREATEKQSAANRRVRSSSKLGVKGVRQRGDKFYAQITIAGSQKFIGSFETLELAQKAYANEARLRDGEFVKL